MKQAKKLKVFGLMTMLISMVFMVSSCSDDDTGGGALSYGKVTGVVTDDLSGSSDKCIGNQQINEP